MEALLICDNDDERAVLPFALQRMGVVTRVASGVEEALTLWEEQPTDLILLAISGYPLEAARQLRAMTIVPLLLIIDGLTEDEQVRLVDEGKALLLMRPYSIRLLMHQVPLLIRYTSGVSSGLLSPLMQGEVRLNPERRTVQVGDQPIQRLSKLEFRLLYLLMRHAGQVLPPDSLVEQVWSSGKGNRRILQNLIFRLRKRVEPVPSQPRYLLTVGSVGYTFQGSEGENP